MKNIVVATEKKGYYEILEESCKKNNIELIPIGLGQKWTGFTTKFRLWKEYLNKLPDDEIVMINDAYDVVILRDSSIILEKFKKYNNKILFATQNGNTAKQVFLTINNNVIAVGSFIGKVIYIKKLIKLIYKYKDIWQKYNNDDQMIVVYILNKEKEFFKKYIELDSNRNFFFATDGDDLFHIPYILNGTIKNLYMKNGELYNNFNNKPMVLHLAGNINGNKYIKYLNYNTSNIKFGLHGFYKINQILNFIKIIIRRNILLILIITFIIYKFKYKKPVKY